MTFSSCGGNGYVLWHIYQNYVHVISFSLYMFIFMKQPSYILSVVCVESFINVYVQGRLLLHMFILEWLVRYTYSYVFPALL